MTKTQKLQIEQSEMREKINELLGLDSLTDEQRTDLKAKTDRGQELETELRAAIVAEAAEQPAPEKTGDPVDAETRERLELRAKASLGSYLNAAMNGRPVSGAEAELAAAHGCAGSVPLELFQPERRERTEDRAVTPGVGDNDAQQNLAGIVPAIFDRSASAWLGIDMPMVGAGDAGYPILSTSVSGGPKAKSAAGDESAGAFTVTSVQPRRVTGSFRFRMEDAARLTSMEDALRTNLSGVLSDAVDNQAINGSGSGDGTINGLLAILSNPPAPAANAETFARYVTAAASHVDGLYAVDLAGVRQLVGPHTYRHAAGVFRANEDSMTAESWLTTRTGGLRTSRRIADPASNIQQAIVRRSNPAGDQVAVMPVWQGLELIRDPYSDAAKGEVVVTGIMLVGDLVLLRSSCFVQDSYRLA